MIRDFHIPLLKWSVSQKDQTLLRIHYSRPGNPHGNPKASYIDRSDELEFITFPAGINHK